MTWHLLIIDDHPLFLEGISSVLDKFMPDVSMETAVSATAGMAKAASSNFDLVLLDLGLPDLDGYAAISEFHRRFPSLPVVVISAKERIEDMRHAIEVGALGYIPKSLPMHDIISAIEQVLRGEVYIPNQKPSVRRHDTRAKSTIPELMDTDSLSLRQIEVLSLLCHGKTNRQIALELELAEKTVKSYVTSIFRSLGVINRTQAVLAAKQLGLTKN